MRDRLLGLLACPEDKGRLELEGAVRDGEDIRSGILRCRDCGFGYPIEEGIPNLLPQVFHRDEVEDSAGRGPG